jgi:prepilin-type N-terminal cleavage/methylation domain-containing protein
MNILYYFRKKEKKGFTLIEMLVAITLIAVSAGIIIATSVSISASNLRSCVNIANSLLSKCRVNSLYRPDPVFVEYSISAGRIIGRYYENGEQREERILGNANRITVTYTADETEFDLSSGALRLSFSRGKGALMDLQDIEGNTQSGLVTQIRFSSGNSTYAIVIVPSTGNRSVRAV